MNLPVNHQKVFFLKFVESLISIIISFVVHVIQVLHHGNVFVKNFCPVSENQ